MLDMRMIATKRIIALSECLLMSTGSFWPCTPENCTPREADSSCHSIHYDVIVINVRSMM